MEDIGDRAAVKIETRKKKSPNRKEMNQRNQKWKVPFTYSGGEIKYGITNEDLEQKYTHIFQCSAWALIKSFGIGQKSNLKYKTAKRKINPTATRL